MTIPGQTTFLDIFRRAPESHLPVLVIPSVPKKVKRVPVAILCLLLTANLAFGFGAADGAVLCIGAEGHVGIESKGVACCFDPSIGGDRGHRTPRRPRAEAALDRCEPCTDIPIGRAATSLVARTSTRGVEPLRRQIDHARLAPAALAEAALDASPPSTARLVLSASLAYLESPVLLI